MFSSGDNELLWISSQQDTYSYERYESSLIFKLCCIKSVDVFIIIHSFVGALSKIGVPRILSIFIV